MNVFQVLPSSLRNPIDKRYVFDSLRQSSSEVVEYRHSVHMSGPSFLDRSCPQPFEFLGLSFIRTETSGTVERVMIS